MIFKKRLTSIGLLLPFACGLILAPAGAQTPRKLRVAIMNFDYTDVRSEASALFGSSIDVGRGMSNLVTSDLIKDGTFTVIGQDELDKTMAAEDYTDSDRNDLGGAIKLARLVRADVIIVGKVTQFDPGAQNSDSTPAASPDSKTRVRVEARVVDVETGQVQGVAEGVGESTGSSTVLLGGWIGWARNNDNFASTDFQQTVIGKAIKTAADQLSSNLVVNASKRLPKTVKQDGIIAAIEGTQLILNIGSSEGVMPGDLFEVVRLTKQIKDPSTGEIIRQLTTTVGVLKATDVDSKSAVCTVVSGSGFLEGDHVRATQ